MEHIGRVSTIEDDKKKALDKDYKKLKTDLSHTKKELVTSQTKIKDLEDENSKLREALSRMSQQSKSKENFNNMPSKQAPKGILKSFAPEPSSSSSSSMKKNPFVPIVHTASLDKQKTYQEKVFHSSGSSTPRKSPAASPRINAIQAQRTTQNQLLAHNPVEDSPMNLSITESSPMAAQSPSSSSVNQLSMSPAPPAPMSPILPPMSPARPENPEKESLDSSQQQAEIEQQNQEEPKKEEEPKQKGDEDEDEDDDDSMKKKKRARESSRRKRRTKKADDDDDEEENDD